MKKKTVNKILPLYNIFIDYDECPFLTRLARFSTNWRSGRKQGRLMPSSGRQNKPIKNDNRQKIQIGRLSQQKRRKLPVLREPGNFSKYSDSSVTCLASRFRFKTKQNFINNTCNNNREWTGQLRWHPANGRQCHQTLARLASAFCVHSAHSPKRLPCFFYHFIVKDTQT